jgi:uncharacterized protein (DUF302 family)
MMIYTSKTSQPIEIVKQQLETKAKEAGFGLLNTYDFKEILQSKGFPIEHDISVFELCNPKGAQEALSSIPSISVYLPCRISIYEENGVTYLSTISVEDILSSVGVDEKFNSFMETLFKDLKKVMHSWDD